jgi:endonuclease/exonuclease/phosphatase family metal-dependent hydrolase
MIPFCSQINLMPLTRFLFLLLIILSITQFSIAGGIDKQHIRFATFNIAMGLKNRDDLYQRLQSGDDEALQKVAAVIQQVRPDVLLLNEFDWTDRNSATLFVTNYLEKPQFGNAIISYAHTLTADVNTGLDSGLDLNNNGVLAEAADAWGFGQFHGQYAMAVFSRLPMQLKRSFQQFKWDDMPNALRALNADGSDWYPEEVSKQLRLSSKNHWDIEISVDDQIIHFLTSHPTPPVFDGPEDRNGTRNHDEIRLWADYVDPQRAGYIYDDTGIKGGLAHGARFVIAGDLNSDPVDGDSYNNAIGQLLDHPLVNNGCTPASKGGTEASKIQGGKNLEHKGNPAFDTGDFNDKYTGNMRIDYVLPSANLNVSACGVYWPSSDEPGHEFIDVSDHHLVWVDIEI